MTLSAAFNGTLGGVRSNPFNGTLQSVVADHLVLTREPSTPISHGGIHGTQPRLEFRSSTNTLATSETSIVTATMVVLSGSVTPLGVLTKAGVGGIVDFDGNGLGANSPGGGTFRWDFSRPGFATVSSQVITVEPAATVNVGQIKQYLTFFVDDAHTVDGAVVTGIPTISQTTCSTDPGHVRPHMMLVEEGVDISVDLVESSVAIGSIQLKVQDTRRSLDQNTGWFTYLLADLGGKTAMLGQRVSFKQIDQYGQEYNVDLLIQEIKDWKEKTGYTITTRDMRERERTMGLFYRAEEAVVWPSPLLGPDNTGVRDGYGRRNPADPASTPILAPSRGARATWKMNGYDAAVPAGRFDFKDQPWVDVIPEGPTDWKNLVGQYNVISPGTYDLTVAATSQGSRMMTSQLTGMTVQWRPWGSAGAWKELRNSPVWEIHQSANSLVGGQWGFYYWKSKSNSKGLQWEMAGVIIGGRDFTEIPTNNQEVEVRVLSGQPPSAAAPIYFEGTFGLFLKRCYDGFYSLQATGIRYNQAVMNDLVVNSPIMRLIKTEIEKEGMNWLQDNWYKPMRMIPLINAAGEIVPTSYEAPDASVTLVTLDNTNVETLDWSHGLGDAITGVEFTYKRDYVSSDNKIHSIDVHVDKLDAPGVTRAGDRTVKLQPETVREVTADVAAAYGQAGGLAAEYAYYLAQKIETGLIDRFSLGGQHCVGTVLRSDAAVRNLVGGQWVIVAVTWLPDYVSKLKGINRLMQVVDIKDTDPTVRHIELVDAGPYQTPLVIPVIGDVSAVLDGATIKIIGSNVPLDVYLAVEVATSPTQPGPNDPAWMRIGRKRGTSPATSLTIQSGELPAGVTFVRVRHEQEGRRPSAWLQVTSLTLPSLLLLGMALSVDAAGNVTATWRQEPGALGLRFYYGVYNPGVTSPPPGSIAGFVDVSTGVGSYTFPVKIKQFQRLIVDAVAYPGWSGVGVTGTAGPLQRLNEATREDDNLLLPEMQEQTSETATTGFLQLVPFDPSGLIHSVETQTYKGLTMIHDWVVVLPDSSGVYSDSVPLADQQVSIISYRIKIYQADGSLVYMKAKPIRYAIGGKPLPPQLSYQPTADGLLAVTIIGDSSTTGNRVAISLDSPVSLDILEGVIPAPPGVTVSGYMGGRSNTFPFGANLLPGQKYYVTAVSYNINLGGTVRSQGSDLIWQTDQWVGPSTSQAKVQVQSHVSGPKSISIIVVLSPQTTECDIFVREFRADPGAPFRVDKTGYRLKTINGSETIEVPVAQPQNYVLVTAVARDALNRVGTEQVFVEGQNAHSVTVKIQAAAGTVTLPASPSNLAATVTGPNVDLAITMPSSNLPDTLRIKRDGTIIAEVVVTAGAGVIQHFSDNGLAPGTYQYEVWGLKAGVSASVSSPTANATISPVAVDGPTLVVGPFSMANQGYQITVTPGSNTPPDPTYILERRVTNHDGFGNPTTVGPWTVVNNQNISSWWQFATSRTINYTTHELRVKTTKAGYTDSVYSAVQTRNVPNINGSGPA